MGTLTISNDACNVVIYSAEYGLLYNWYAATDIKNITSSDNWILPTSANLDTLSTYLGGNSVSGGKLKEAGTTHWITPNTGATNEVGFNAVGSGTRIYTNGGFNTLKSYSYLWTSNSASSTDAAQKTLAYDSAGIVTTDSSKKFGFSIRLLYVGAGTPSFYVGNDRKGYPIVQIGSQYWTAINLCETKFRTGDTIPYHGLNNVDNFTNAEWAALTTSGTCAYDNTLSNVAPGFTFPS